MDKKLNMAGQELFYRVYGEGYPVLLLHGFAEDGAIWQVQTNWLKKKYKVIVPDIPGSGKSAFNDHFKTIADFAETIKALLIAEEHRDCILIGHSMGGYIALAFADKYPQWLRALGLFHSSAYADSEEKKTARRKSIEFILEHGAAAFISTTIPNLFAPSFNQSHAAKVSEIINEYSGFNPDALIRYYEAMILRPEKINVLEQIQKPVLFVIGEEDKAISFQDSLKQCHIPAISFIHILKNNGHMGMIENPEKSNLILEHFLEQSSM